MGWIQFLSKFKVYQKNRRRRKKRIKNNKQLNFIVTMEFENNEMTEKFNCFFLCKGMILFQNSLIARKNWFLLKPFLENYEAPIYAICCFEL